ncbi:MAG: hypothetical protein AB7G13_11590 [Lautropia sp.]
MKPEPHCVRRAEFGAEQRAQRLGEALDDVRACAEAFGCVCVGAVLAAAFLFLTGPV